MVRTMYLSWLLPLVVLEAAAQTLLCSTMNTASSGANQNIYQTRAACAELCKGQSAYAVVQYDKCWCSNVTPGSTTDVGSCNKPCPGYPSELCGGDNQYSYVLMDKSKIEAAPSSSPPSQAPSSSPPPPSTSESSGTSSSSEKPPPPPQIITITQTNDQGSKTIIKTVLASPSVVEDKPATFRTVTVTGTAAVPTNDAAASNVNPPPAAQQDTGGSSSSSSSSSGGGGGGGTGLSGGTIVGIAVGGTAAGVMMGLVAFMIWRRCRYGDRKGRRVGEAEGGDMGYFGPAGATTTTIRRDNTSASEDSRMGAFGQNKNLCRNSIGSLEDTSSESNQVLRVVNPDIPEKQ